MISASRLFVLPLLSLSPLASGFFNQNFTIIQWWKTGSRCIHVLLFILVSNLIVVLVIDLYCQLSLCFSFDRCSRLFLLLLNNARSFAFIIQNNHHYILYTYNRKDVCLLLTLVCMVDVIILIYICFFFWLEDEQFRNKIKSHLVCASIAKSNNLIYIKLVFN